MYVKTTVADNEWTNERRANELLKNGQKSTIITGDNDRQTQTLRIETAGADKRESVRERDQVQDFKHGAEHTARGQEVKRHE